MFQSFLFDIDSRKNRVVCKKCSVSSWSESYSTIQCYYRDSVSPHLDSSTSEFPRLTKKRIRHRVESGFIYSVYITLDLAMLKNKVGHVSYKNLFFQHMWTYSLIISTTGYYRRWSNSNCCKFLPAQPPFFYNDIYTYLSSRESCLH